MFSMKAMMACAVLLSETKLIFKNYTVYFFKHVITLHMIFQTSLCLTPFIIVNLEDMESPHLIQSD